VNPDVSAHLTYHLFFCLIVLSPRAHPTVTNIVFSLSILENKNLITWLNVMASQKEWYWQPIHFFDLLTQKATTLITNIKQRVTND
jgi:hypothetical protein